MERAHTNLDERQAKIAIEPTPSKGPNETGTFATVADLGYEGALLASEAFRKRAGAQLGTPFFAGVPNRGFLVMWSRDFEHKTEFTKRVERDFRERTHPISPDIYVVSGDSVTPATGLRKEIHLKWD